MKAWITKLTIKGAISMKWPFLLLRMMMMISTNNTYKTLWNGILIDSSEFPLRNGLALADHCGESLDHKSHLLD